MAIVDGSSDSIRARLEALKSACNNDGVIFEVLDASKQNHLEIPQTAFGDLVYRVSRGGHALENLLLKPPAISFYSHGDPFNLNFADTSTLWSVLHERHGLPIPTTIHDIRGESELLIKYVNHLGGFPVVIKASGGTLGVGVMRADSTESLFSVVDYAIACGAKLMMRRFIEPGVTVRAYVVGSEVNQAIQYATPPGDFRSNAGPIKVQPFKLPEDVARNAVRAVACLGIEAGAVDMVSEKGTDRFHVLEVNFPFGFSTTDPEHLARAMIRFLKDKALRSKEGEDSAGNGV